MSATLGSATLTPAIVGALACQRNSFLKTFKTKVASSFEYVPPATAKEKQNVNKKAKSKGDELNEPEHTKQTKYAVELEDTIFFPEGGGQPFDRGAIILPDQSQVEVSMVLRNKLLALHITDTPIETGTEVNLKIDWERRIDAMQQHTGQHLLSAVFDGYGLETLSWSMGEMVNYIELPQKISEEMLTETNKKINDLIFEGLPIKVINPAQYGDGEIDISHIPDDYDLSKGIIRAVKIGEIDENPCCGTHLTNTLQIQSIALLHQTNVRGGNSRLHFVCGSRVYKYLRKENDILKYVSGNQLSCQEDEIKDKVELLKLNYKKALSREQNLLKEIASSEARRIFNEFELGSKECAVFYRQDCNPEFLLLLQKELSTLINNDKKKLVDLDNKNTVTLINGDYPSGFGGTVKIIGPKAPEIQLKLKGIFQSIKGGGKGNSFQGKVVKYGKGEIESALEYLEALP